MFTSAFVVVPTILILITVLLVIHYNWKQRRIHNTLYPIIEDRVFEDLFNTPQQAMLWDSLYYSDSTYYLNRIIFLKVISANIKNGKLAVRQDGVRGRSIIEIKQV